MNKTIIAAALLAVVGAAPALAKTPRATTDQAAAPAPGAYARVAPGMPAIASPNAVYDGQRYVGTDPDPNVRLQLLRDADSIEGF